MSVRDGISRFQTLSSKAERTNSEAKALIEADGRGRREKTARLKALRMEKEQADKQAADAEAEAKKLAKKAPRVKKATK